jgi:hypothetical protein
MAAVDVVMLIEKGREYAHLGMYEKAVDAMQACVDELYR